MRTLEIILVIAFNIMDILREIAYVLQKNGLHPAMPTAPLVEKGSRMAVFYDDLLKGEFLSDEDAAYKLYGDKQASGYRKMKSDLLGRLTSNLIYVHPDQSHFTDYQKAYYICHQQWVAIKILIGQNANRSAMTLASKLLKQAQQYEFTLLVMDIASYLRIQYSIRESNDKKYKQLSATFDYYLKLYEAEAKAEQIYTTLSVQIANSYSNNSAVYQAAIQGHNLLKPALEKYDGIKLHLYGRLVQFMSYKMAHDYKNALECCEEGIAFFKAKPYQANAPLQIFLYEQLVCQVQLRQFQEGKHTIATGLALLEEGSFNWFKFQEIAFKLYLHAGQFQEAVHLFIDTVSHQRFRYLPENIREVWSIYELYVHFLEEAHLLSDIAKKWKFNGTVFLNETPIYSKDKEGLNIAIIVANFLILLAEGEKTLLIDRAEVIEQYAYRHMKSIHTRRSVLFFKMLTQVVSGRFERTQVEKKAEKHLNGLLKIPLDVANQTFEIEVIPYEMLWELVLKLLAQNALSVRRASR